MRVDPRAEEGVLGGFVFVPVPGGGAVAEFLQLPFITVCNALALNREPGIPPIFTHWVYQEASWTHLRNQVVSYISDLTVQPFHMVVARYRRKWKLPPLRGSDLFFANSQLALNQPAARYF